MCGHFSSAWSSHCYFHASDLSIQSHEGYAAGKQREVEPWACSMGLSLKAASLPRGATWFASTLQRQGFLHQGKSYQVYYRERLGPGIPSWRSSCLGGRSRLQWGINKMIREMHMYLRACLHFSMWNAGWKRRVSADGAGGYTPLVQVVVVSCQSCFC